MLKMFKILEQKTGNEAWINPEEIQAIYGMGSGPNNLGHTRIYMKTQVYWDIEGYARDLINKLKEKQVLETWNLRQEEEGSSE